MTGRGRGPDGAARARILVEASRLFAVRGFHGTSTRDIAAAVGIRQPTLYSHFPSKHAILAALLDADLRPALSRVRTALDLEATPAARLHALLVADVSAILSLPYDVRGFYNDEVLDLLELDEQSRLREELHTLTARLVGLGIDSGEFLDEDPAFVRGAITGLTLQAVSERGPEPAANPAPTALRIADFVVRALLADRRHLPRIQKASDTLVGTVASAANPGEPE
ncbi:TetR/AcrR family transcriptional regulator [Kineosporia sp. R_H_3]|uniref:TetR/AcrR family transcriptional regulator n=1 Tax=Kineosporia sp. R_H_3 TaxID=1961848 RepID=UPI000B4AE77E|nr:TetR/AcrR family transcriptional regulator [Kineosporia sp. R_H_3]